MVHHHRARTAPRCRKRRITSGMSPKEKAKGQSQKAKADEPANLVRTIVRKKSRTILRGRGCGGWDQHQASAQSVYLTTADGRGLGGLQHDGHARKRSENKKDI